LTIFGDNLNKALPVMGIFVLAFWNPSYMWITSALVAPIDATFIQGGAIVSQWFLVPISCLAILVEKGLYFTMEYGIVRQKIGRSIINLPSFSSLRFDKIESLAKFGMNL
jgi:hypothetical protein